MLSLYISALVLHCQHAYDLHSDLSTQNHFHFNKIIIVEIIDVVIMVSDARIVILKPKVYRIQYSIQMTYPEALKKPHAMFDVMC